MKNSIQNLAAVSILTITLSISPVSKERQEAMKQFYTNLPVLITGGCGFIGSHIAETLVNLGAKVTIVDNLATGSLDNIATFKDKVTFINKSIIDKEACLEATKNKKVIFHLAAFISVPESLENPQLCYETNVNGTLNLLEAARINGIERFVFSSSAAVYGNTEGICSEDDRTNPESPYGYSKRIGELYCQQYAKNFGLPTVMLRYFNVYGPRQNPNGQYAAVVAKFSNQMQHNLPITIFGDGKQTRDFVPVEKVAEANLLLGMLENNKIRGQIFNIGIGSSISLIELLDQLKQKFPGYTGAIQFAPARPGDLKYSAADCSKYFELDRVGGSA